MNNCKRLRYFGALSFVALIASSSMTAPAQVFPASTPQQQALGNFVAIPAGPGVEFRTALLPPQLTNPIVPTDVTGPGGSLGYSRDLRRELLGPDRNTVPNSHALIVARDPRYSFTGQWLPLYQGQLAAALPATVVGALPARSATTMVLSQAAVIATPAATLASAEALDAKLRLPYIDFGNGRLSPIAQIMPSAGAQIQSLACNRLLLTRGAMMVKTGTQDAAVMVPLAGGEQAVVSIARGCIAMVSAFDGHMTVANLHDSARDSVVLSMNDATTCGAGSMPVRIGYMEEVYPNCGACPENELVAYTILGRNAFSNGYTVETTRFSYPRAMKRFNITCSLDQCDVRTILKSAAALSYTDREREWNGLTPYAP